MQEDSEVKLVLRLKDGDPKAFGKLYNIYSRRLYYYILGYLKSKEDAEEVLQEVFLKVWKYKERLKEEFHFNAYLFTIAYNDII